MENSKLAIFQAENGNIESKFQGENELEENLFNGSVTITFIPDKKEVKKFYGKKTDFMQKILKTLNHL